MRYWVCKFGAQGGFVGLLCYDIFRFFSENKGFAQSWLGLRRAGR
jgi:hypothetical protein